MVGLMMQEATLRSQLNTPDTRSQTSRAHRVRWPSAFTIFLALLVSVSSAMSAAAAGAWTPTGSMATARGVHTATLLPSGRVLVAGGNDGFSVLTSAELYDPVAGTWSETGSMIDGRHLHTATLLPSGKVLVAGGQKISASDVLASAELYDPVTGTWKATGNMTHARSFHTATLLPS